MRLILEPVWNWPLLAVTAVVMFALLFWTYPARVRHLARPWQVTLIALRTLAALALLFAMLRPAVQVSETDKQVSELLMVMDRSRSMSTPDGPGGLSRRQAMLKMLEDNADALRAIAEEIDVRYLDFASDLKPAEKPENLADGNATAIGKTIDALREQEAGDRLLGVVMMSDGAQRAVGEDDIDPLGAARRFAEQRGAPIHSVVFGTSELSSSGLDLAVEDLSLDQPVTFERKTVPVRFQVRMLGAAGRTVRVRLLKEDRTGKALGESGPLKEIPISGDARPFRELQPRENAVTVPVELSFIAEQPGEYKIAAEVVPHDGEVKTNNNRIETLITVRKGGLKVAYFDVPRPEQKFLRRLNETAKIQLDTQVILPGELAGRTRLDPQLFTPGNYDVYLIGDVPASVFVQDGKNYLEEIAARVREGSGLGMIGGIRNFGAGGYAGTPLVDLLPVRMSIADELRPGEEDPRLHFTSPVRMLPTPDGERHYLMRLTAAGNEQLWRSLPELGGANRLEPKSGAVEVLAETEAGDPLLLATDTGRGRALALAVDESWKWHLRGFESEHQRFWQQLVLWLARKEYDSDQPVWARVEPRNFSPMTRVPIEFGAQDEDGTPIPDARFEVEVIRPDGETVSATPQRFGDHGLADFTQTEEPGDYWVRVAATLDGQSLGTSAMTRFIIDSRDLEMDNPAADPGLLSEVSGMTGGHVVAPEDFGEFLRMLLAEGIPSELQRFRRINLWDGWTLLLLFVLLMTLEWTIRKLRGMV
jgi:uncharacterized membrane protein